MARESDLDRLVELKLALQDHMEKLNPDLWRLSATGCEQVRDQLAEFLSDQDSQVLVAMDNDGVIVGMTIGQIHTSENYVPPSTGSVGLLFVSESWRRRGIGTGLVRVLCQFFNSSGVEDIWVRYVVGNDEATNFWTKLGFRPRIISAGTKLDELDGKIGIKDATDER
jgi:ribosomal protein S18 acetylase RimI-like enzyme